jgi:hypothetical protein
VTIVLALKVGDGIVLGADSASTIIDQGGAYRNSYFNAEKLFNLVKGLPVGAVTFGLGGLAGRSISSLAKDLREKLINQTDTAWYLNPTSYTMQELAGKVRKFFYEDLYVPSIQLGPDAPAMGFLLAGYSATARSSEIWRVFIDQGGTCSPPEEKTSQQEGWGMTWEGQVDACVRLVRGFSLELFSRLTAAGMSPQDATKLLDSVQPLVHPTMPIQDAIDLVHYLIDVTIGFVRFAPGPATVAQPIDSAAITRHEGFRWVRRKHYYSQELNLPLPEGS